MDIHFTPARCLIDLGAISHNFCRLGTPERLMPVIKADAYGHGLLPVAHALAQAGAASFAVGIASEGAALRKAGHNQPILLLMGCQSPTDRQLAVQHRLMPVVGSMAELEALQTVVPPGETLAIAIKTDTGMGRLGFAHHEGFEVAQALQAYSRLRPQMVVSHLACADMPLQEDYTQTQTAAFLQFYQAFKTVYPDIQPSLHNSAAIFNQPDYGIRRPGIALYGCHPLGKDAPPRLEWAMSLYAPILAVHSLKTGQSLSYGRMFTAQRDMQVAVIPAGYATGFARVLSGRGTMLVHGRRAPQIGRICMSMAMIDVTHIPSVNAGDLAWIMGGPNDGPDAPVDAWELAEQLHTIPYEILCLLGSLNPRVYI